MSNAIREPRPGEVLGKSYLIERELGRGGFGVVFKARHVDIDRVVAIKVLLATYASRDPTAKDRFRREATIAASLSYPNSLKVFDYGETDEGVFYLVMEFVSGEDLTKVIAREGPLPPARAIHIARQVLYALSEAHARGIVHRDIKPDNIMVCPLVYDRDFVKVMDFGIAKMVDSGEAITRAGLTLGTPRYMPVEQLRGERLGPTSDLYAVGLVLYEMLVGRAAFQAESAVDTALAVMGGETVRVPRDAGIAAPLAAIIERAASKNAEDRYQSARELLDALAALDPAIAGSVDATTPAAPAPEAGHRATVMMPDLDHRLRPDEDFEDATRTQAVESNALVSVPRGRVDRSAATQSLPVQDGASPAEAPPPAPPAPPSEPSATGTALVTSAVSALRPAAPASAAPAAPAPARPAGLWLGAPPILLVLEVAVLVLLVVLLLRR